MAAAGPDVPLRPQVHLCCGNRSLGSSDVSLSALAAAAVDLEAKGATVEGAFVLRPPPRSKLPALPAELQPTVGVAVTLRREEPAPRVGKRHSASGNSELMSYNNISFPCGSIQDF